MAQIALTASPTLVFFKGGAKQWANLNSCTPRLSGTNLWLLSTYCRSKSFGFGASDGIKGNKSVAKVSGDQAAALSSYTWATNKAV